MCGVCAWQWLARGFLFAAGFILHLPPFTLTFQMNGKLLPLSVDFNLFLPDTVWRRRWPMFTILQFDLSPLEKPLKRTSWSSPSHDIVDCVGVRKCNCRYWIDLNVAWTKSNNWRQYSEWSNFFDVFFLVEKCCSWRKSLSSELLLIWFGRYNWFSDKLIQW